MNTLETSTPPLVTSSVIPDGFAHGFTTRAGGVSDAPYDTLNLGFKWGDQPEAVRENRRRVAQAIGAPELVLASQVHGRAVVEVRDADAPSSIAGQPADALVTDVRGVALAVLVADCVPLVLADARTGACAAVHAGWRGVVAGVAVEALRRLERAFGARPDEVCVAMGPSIGPCCFEVGDEVSAAFAAAWPGAPGVVRAGPGGKPHVDLRQALALQLAHAGVRGPHIDAAAPCTKCSPDRFFSYRRDATRTGQHVGVVMRR